MPQYWGRAESGSRTRNRSLTKRVRYQLRHLGVLPRRSVARFAPKLPLPLLTGNTAGVLKQAGSRLCHTIFDSLLARLVVRRLCIASRLRYARSSVGKVRICVGGTRTRRSVSHADETKSYGCLRMGHPACGILQLQGLLWRNHRGLWYPMTHALLRKRLADFRLLLSRRFQEPKL